jgi:hypothetical protein
MKYVFVEEIMRGVDYVFQTHTQHGVWTSKSKASKSNASKHIHNIIHIYIDVYVYDFGTENEVTQSRPDRMKPPIIGRYFVCG